MARLPDISELSSKQLLELRAMIDDMVAARQSEERDALREKMLELVEAAGMSLDDVISVPHGRPRKNGQSTVAVKYRNPDNPSETWSGRGRRAQWLVEKLERKGAKIEDFAV